MEWPTTTLLAAENKTGYFAVYHYPGKSKPYHAKLKRGGKTVHLGSFANIRQGGRRGPAHASRCIHQG